MKRTFRYLATAAITAAAIAFTACNADDDFYMEPLDSASPETRADVGTDWVTVTFDDVPEDQLAGPSSYGANLYDGYTGSAPARFRTCLLYTSPSPRDPR